ncbi:unnamed protein product [Cuscuta epithymum]|uniref:Transcription factor GAMYB-like n=1 Tax=Cuscuta epithymum TaxID=186058 RepID=A0AAV0FGP1_9ASTE|nr:unnamed protein product [Cuscuta epithymum]
MSMTSESEEMMTSKGSISSASIEEASAGGGTVPLKKGPWTSTEDAILVDYVTRNGEGNWNAVQKNSGLARCGKSCRLRWANHLRPDLKKGAFTPEEERRIIELHAKMGNKWARMAAELPGRTDNEIKNYWNTRIKRRQRAGLPIYPSDLCLKTISAGMQGTFSGGITNEDILHMNTSDIPAVEFKNLGLNHQHSYPPPVILDNNLLGQGLKSSCIDRHFISSAVHPFKRFRGGTETASLFPGANSDLLPACGPYQQSSISPYYFDHGSSFGVLSSSSGHHHPLLLGGVIPGSHASLNGNSCSSSPEPSSWDKKLELPSLQSHMGSWYSSPDTIVDTLIQSPPSIETRSPSPRNSGLLDAVLYESHTKNYNNHTTPTSYQQISDVSPGSAIFDTNKLRSNLNETTGWEAYGDPISPLGHSSASVFSEYTPPVDADKPHSAGTAIGLKVKEEVEEEMEWSPPIQYDESNQYMFSRTDLLASNAFRHQTNHHNKNHSVLKEVFGAVLFDDLSRECKNLRSMATPSGACPCPWDAMSTV